MKIESTEEELKFIFKTLILALFVLTVGFIALRTISHLKEVSILEYNRDLMEAQIEVSTKKVNRDRIQKPDVPTGEPSRVRHGR
jgi:hypothetical protein